MIRTIYIDDEPLLLELAKDFIEDGVEFTMDTTTSIEEALHRVTGDDYDAVICDYQMPAMNGIEFLKALRSKGDVTPFILFTGRGREEVAIEALNSGVDFYLKKGGEPSSQFAELKNLLIQMSRRRQAEDAMTHNAKRFRAMIENSMDIIGVMDRSSTLRYVSPSIYKILGYSVDEVIGTNLMTYAHPDMLESLGKVIQTLRPGRAERYEISLRHKNGTYRLLESSIAVMPTDLGPNQIVVNGRDITERRKKEDELHHSEEMVRYIVGHAPNAMAIQDTELRYLMVSDQYITRFDIYDQDVIGRTPHEIFARLPEGWDEICENALMGKAMKGEADFPLENREEHVQYEIRPWQDATGEVGGLVTYIAAGPESVSLEGSDRSEQRYPLLEAVHDVTEKRQVGEAVAESERRFRTLFQNTQLSITIAYLDGEIVDVNEQFARMMGQSPEELKGKNIYQLQTPLIRAEDSDLLNSLLTNDGSNACVDRQWVRKDGSTWWGHVVGSLLYDDSGNPKYVLAVVLDITERKNSEMKMAIANRKLVLLGDLTRHDVKNRLSAMSGFLQLAEMKATDLLLKSYLSKASQLAVDIAGQMDFSKEYQKLGSQEARWIPLAQECLTSRSGLELGDIQLDESLNGVEIYADPMVPKGFRNLIENAVKHGEHVTKVTIRHLETSEGMTLVFEDDGVGISDEEKKMIFEWGHKNRMGHGLHFVSEMLAITGLSIKEVGVYGKGARFEVFVPNGSYRIAPCESQPGHQEEVEQVATEEVSVSDVVYKTTV